MATDSGAIKSSEAPMVTSFEFCGIAEIPPMVSNLNQNWCANRF
jgi:hypothetical protein